MSILAAGDDGTIKLIGGAIVAAIWVIAQVAGALNKKPTKMLPPSRPIPTPQQRPRPRPTGSLPDLPPMRLPEQFQRPMPTRSVPPMPKIAKRPKPRPAAVQQVTQAPSLVQRPRPALTAAAEPKAPAAPVLPRRQMVDALMRPRNLKKAFIITELLGPPVALRPPRDE